MEIPDSTMIMMAMEDEETLDSVLDIMPGARWLEAIRLLPLSC